MQVFYFTNYFQDRSAGLLEQAASVNIPGWIYSNYKYTRISLYVSAVHGNSMTINGTLIIYSIPLLFTTGRIL